MTGIFPVMPDWGKDLLFSQAEVEEGVFSGKKKKWTFHSTSHVKTNQAKRGGLSAIY